jgi:hypothetical protein
MLKSSAAQTLPGAPSAARDEARAERRTKLLAFFDDPPADVLAAADTVGRAREHYGDDTDRELADLDSGRHVLQRRRSKPAAR